MSCPAPGTMRRLRSRAFVRRDRRGRRDRPISRELTPHWTERRRDDLCQWHLTRNVIGVRAQRTPLGKTVRLFTRFHALRMPGGWPPPCNAGDIFSGNAARSSYPPQRVNHGPLGAVNAEACSASLLRLGVERKRCRGTGATATRRLDAGPRDRESGDPGNDFRPGRLHVP